MWIYYCGFRMANDGQPVVSTGHQYHHHLMMYECPNVQWVRLYPQRGTTRRPWWSMNQGRVPCLDEYRWTQDSLIPPATQPPAAAARQGSRPKYQTKNKKKKKFISLGIIASKAALKTANPGSLWVNLVAHAATCPPSVRGG